MLLSLFTVVFLIILAVALVTGVKEKAPALDLVVVLFAMCILFGLGYAAGYNQGITLGRQALEAYILSTLE